MAIAIGPNGERLRVSFPYRGERFTITRYGLLEKTDEFPNGKVDEVIAEDSETGFSLVTREEAYDLVRDWRAGPGRDLDPVLRDRVEDLVSSVKWVGGLTKAGQVSARRKRELDQIRTLIADHPGTGIAELASDLEIPGFTATQHLRG